ncbi:MAG: serine hydrolase [Deltaproteobacteria bacterium]|uniref:serine hydrolase domain-containing protein n=1 Tax=Desulfobacula sp. TaxID=2593537 RepID=UPI0019B985CD|nr:serine hydrolase [Candidatus Desulfobacula maris]MBL6995261.1 serine hydrolase [Desulfobacula sp.]
MFSQRYCYIFTHFILIFLSLVGCGPSAEDSKIDYTPIAVSDWKVSTPDAQGLDPGTITKLYCNAGKLETIYSLLVVKNGYLIAEGYFNSGSVKQKSIMASVTKSFTSALVGIALDQRLLSNIDQKMLDFFPELASQISDPRKQKITLRKMLEMRAGYPWEKTHADLIDGLFSGLYPPLIEKFPLASDPGTRFHYSNMTSNWIGLIIARSSGISLKAFAEKNLFTPLGVKVGEWVQDVEGNNIGCGGLHLTARDAAKFGLLYLNNGKFNGNQIVPENWVKNSLQTYSVNEGPKKKVGHFRDIGYGYHWWSAKIDNHRVNFAWGHGGQLIVLVDHLDMVIVTTAYPYRKEYSRAQWKNEKAILKMVSKFVSSLT